MNDSNPQPCFVCGNPTVNVRSISCPSSPPKSKQDEVRICSDCFKPWKSALTVTCNIEEKNNKDGNPSDC